MIRAVLLDLDNTMVLFDENAYVREYFRLLFPWFSDLLSSEELEKRVIGATMGLRRSTGAESNRSFFLNQFCSGNGAAREEVWRRFMAFYEKDYAGIRVKAAPPAGLSEVLGTLARSRLKVVLASNPVFPKIAQQTRMSWAGIGDSVFDLYTHIENMAFVKPAAGYYHQICDMLREPPSACLMVGNDAVGDMAAKLAGLKTYRTTDAEEAGVATVSLTDGDRGRMPAVPAPDFTGPLSGLLPAIRDLQERYAAGTSQAPIGIRGDDAVPGI